MIAKRSMRLLLLSLFAAVAAGCAESERTPTTPQAADRPLAATTYGATLIECPIDVTRTVSATIGLDGGTIELDGHKLTIPIGALLLPTEFTLTVPASNYVEIDIKAAGQEHFQFEKAVSLTLSYGRCDRNNLRKSDLRIYYIDANTNTILEDLGGTDYKDRMVVTTTTDHLSDYALGSP